MLAYGPGFDSSWRPPRVALNPNLTDDDVAWLNGQLELVDAPTVRFAREIAIPPLPSGIAPRLRPDPRISKQPPDTSWIRMTGVRR